MIEPSKASIKQGIKYLQAFFNDCVITTFNDTAGKITSDSLCTNARTVIHIFSNVTDKPWYWSKFFWSSRYSRNWLRICVAVFIGVLLRLFAFIAYDNAITKRSTFS